jgi:UDP-N-acetylglucosamine:LPS N-acetylglucosamine transferase
MSARRPILIMAGGTGGHVFPALALARLLRAASHEVVWLGTKSGLEARVVPAENIAIEWLSMSGLRGKGAATLLLAVVCTAGAFVLFYSLVARLGPTRAQVISLLVPLFAIGWGWLVLDEQPTLAMAAACAAVLVGVCLCLVAHRLPGPPRG